MQCIDIHTHRAEPKGFALINLFPKDVSGISENKYYSIGIHPWDCAEAEPEKELAVIAEAARLSNVLALGEIGLDKLRPDFEKQEQLFKEQFKIAESLGKPVIIHCVKAYSELLHFLKKEKPSIPIIIHRYSGNISIARELIKFACSMSFGHELFNTKSKTPKVFTKIPLEHIFLETDDADIAIKEVYQKAAELRNISEEILSEQIAENFKRYFPHFTHKSAL